MGIRYPYSSLFIHTSRCVQESRNREKDRSEEFFRMLPKAGATTGPRKSYSRLKDDLTMKHG